MLITLSIISKTEKPSIDELYNQINNKEWSVVEIHEIKNIILNDGEK